MSAIVHVTTPDPIALLSENTPVLPRLHPLARHFSFKYLNNVVPGVRNVGDGYRTAELRKTIPFCVAAGFLTGSFEPLIPLS